MGGKGSGNQTTQREKLPAEWKSRLFQFRLDPKKPEHVTMLHQLEKYLSPDGNTRADQLRELVDIGLIQKGLGEYAERDVRVNSGDVVDIKQIVMYIQELIESGKFAAVSGGSGKKKKSRTLELPDAVRNTLDHYIGGGLSADDEDDY